MQGREVRPFPGTSRLANLGPVALPPSEVDWVTAPPPKPETASQGAPPTARQG